MRQPNIKGKSALKYWQDLNKKRKPIERRTPPTRLPKTKKAAEAVTPVTKKIPGLRQWYLDRIAECDWVCEECGSKVVVATDLYQFSAQAHLLPKDIYSSVAIHPLNHACLGPACGCHNKYDHSWERASEMAVWKKAVKIIVEVLIPLLPADEYAKLPEILKEMYESGYRDSG